MRPARVLRLPRVLYPARVLRLPGVLRPARVLRLPRVLRPACALRPARLPHPTRLPHPARARRHHRTRHHRSAAGRPADTRRVACRRRERAAAHARARGLGSWPVRRAGWARGRQVLAGGRGCGGAWPCAGVRGVAGSSCGLGLGGGRCWRGAEGAVVRGRVRGFGVRPVRRAGWAGGGRRSPRTRGSSQGIGPQALTGALRARAAGPAQWGACPPRPAPRPPSDSIST